DVITKLSRCHLCALGTASPKTCSTSQPCLLSIFCHPGLLVPLQQAAEAEGALQRRVVVVGSSVLLAGPADAVHIHSARWEYLNGSISRAVVQYDEGSHYVAIHPPYVGRALFHPPNGSLLLEDLQESDSGIYKVTINLAERESLKVLLDVLKPVSRPQLWSSGLVAKATGEVLCEVVEGRVDTITWKKDGQALPRGRGFHVSGSLSILHLRAVKKSDCGSYSCNASNGISWQETSLNVTVAGLSPPLKDVLRIAVVAVVFAAVSGWGLVIPVCQSEKLRIRGELWRWLSAYTCGLVCVSSILAGTAGLLWMREEGPSIAVILPEIVLLYVIVVTFLVAANVTFQPTKLIQLKSTTAQRTMGYTAPGGVLLVVLTSSFHIKNIHHRHEDGCTAFVDVTALAVSTAAVSALPLLAIFLCYHTTQGWQNERDSSCAEKERSSRSFEMSLPNIKDPVPTC
uniref:Ig-like domain-containing protein n=1 Tax=Anas platyrhynchos platyrhynchos TaxID=8840 RepID=A0A493U445_ANAPP